MTVAELDLELTAYWWHWRRALDVLDAGGRTCRKGHDWQTYKITLADGSERCGQCNRDASRRIQRRKDAA